MTWQKFPDRFIWQHSFVVTIRWLYFGMGDGAQPSRMERDRLNMVTAEEAMVRNPIDAPFIPVKSSQGLKGSRVETRRLLLLLHCTPPPLFGFK